MTGGTDWTGALGRRASRRGVLRGGALAGAGLAGAVLVGCGDDEEDPVATPVVTPEPDETPAPVDEPRSGGTLGLSSNVPQDNFNPVINAWEGLGLSAQQVYDTPISPRMDERIMVLEAAESAEIADDLTVVITLKEGLVYQDRPPVNGRDVLAEDIALVHEYVRDEPAATDRIFQSSVMDRVEAPDDRTVVFHLQQPSAYLFTGAQLGWPHNNCIIPSELVLGDLNQTEPVGSGPYQLKSFQFQVRYDYERNPTFRDADRGLPYIDERVRIVLVDVSAMEAAFRSEQIQVYWVPPAETADRLIGDLGDRIEAIEFLSVSPITWNMASSREWSQDVRVREAFYRAFDAEEFIELVANGWAVPVPGQVHWALEQYRLPDEETAPFKRHDPREARQLLEAAGFDFDRTYEVTTIQAPVNETGIQVFGEQLRRVGLRNISFKAEPTAEWFANTSTPGNYDFVGFVGHPGLDTPQRTLRLNHSDPLSHHQAMNIRDPEIDLMIEESEQLVDREEHIEKVQDLQRLLLERYAHLSYVYNRVDRELRWAYIRDFEQNPASHAMFRTEAWLDV